MKSIAHTCLLSIITMRDDNNIFTKSLKMYWYKLYKKVLFTQFIREQKRLTKTCTIVYDLDR